MGKQFEELTPDLREWIERQRMFFVATAPRADDGLLNCSPKGMDTFRIISPHEVGYLDLTGSGIETAAHVGENGRIIFMFCAFDGPPKILRLHGTAAYYMRASPEFRDVQGLFPVLPGTRGIVRARLTRISDSCGWAVPRYGSSSNETRSSGGQSQKARTHWRTSEPRRMLEALTACPA